MPSSAERNTRAAELKKALAEAGLQDCTGNSRFCQKYILGEDGVTIELVVKKMRTANYLIHETPYARINGQKQECHKLLCSEKRDYNDVYRERDALSTLSMWDVENNTPVGEVECCTAEKCLIAGFTGTIDEAEMNNGEMRLLNHNSFKTLE